MSNEYPISKASLSDAAAIASLFSLSWTSPFSKLTSGNVEPTALAESMAPRISEHMRKESIVFIVARDPETQNVVSVAQWKLPSTVQDEEEHREETTEEKEERQQFEDENHRRRLPETSNKDLIMDFMAGVRNLQEQLLPDAEYHYRLQNLATHPDYRGQGLASKVITYVFPQADENGQCIYLETASDNQALSLYKKLGFREKGSSVIEDLSKYGGEGSHTHIALIRYPNSKA